MNLAKPAVMEMAQISRPEDFVALRIVDWNRWSHPNLHGAMNNMPRWLVGCWYTVIKYDLSKEPLRQGFKWGHFGESHEDLGHRYWSMFKRVFPSGEIVFGDEPDFSGHFTNENGQRRQFQGDIGIVSASSFFLNAVPQLREGDLWISVFDDKQIIIEASYDIGDEVVERITALLGLE